MRANILLATIFALLGLLLEVLFFIFVNVQIPIEPLATWSDTPYANMFQYTGLVCLLGAVIFFIVDRLESSDRKAMDAERKEAQPQKRNLSTAGKITINAKNLLIISVMVLINLAAFILGGYHTLTPILYIAGFIGIIIISYLVGNNLETKSLLALIISATVLSFFDEYAHISVSNLTYFDGFVPSPLTVFGWSVFMISLVGITRPIVNSRWLQIKDNEKLRTLPVFIVLVCILIVVVLQGYASVFNWVLVLLYLFLFAGSFYYTHIHALKWNLFLMITSLILGLSMEYVGGLQGLWVFRDQQPISVLILFSWPLRVLAVNAICYAGGFDFSKDRKKRRISFAEEKDSDKSIIVVADTHFGLKKEKQNCDPQAFSDFLDWVVKLEKKGMIRLNLGSWSDEKEMFVRAPERLVFLGDIMELWDASKESVDVCSRSIFQTASKLTCEKIYVLGNHDHELIEISGSYPLGKSSIDIVKEDGFLISKGNKKFMFLHGHQFDGLFTLPSWRIMPLLNRMANLLGNFAWFFVALWAINIALSGSFGVNGVVDWISLIALGAISVPFLAVRFGRELWNRIRTTRYEPEKAEVRLENWWKELSESVKTKEINIVYGHTHSMSFWSSDIGENRLTLFNLPSWIRDQNEKDGISLENIFRHGFLYVDCETIEFVGWDTENKRPFFIPKNLIQERQQSKFPIVVTKEFNKELLQIGWPQKLIDKWFGDIFPRESLA